MKTLVLFLITALSSSLYAQVVPPQPTPPTPKVDPKIVPPVKFKTVAPTTVKIGEHIIVDAESAKGNVFFFFDETAFPPKRATLSGKKLILSTSVTGSYTIHVASLEDAAKEKIVVKVEGDGPMPPPDPPPVDPLEALRLEMRAGFDKLAKQQNQTQLDIAGIKERLAALEAPRPPPVPPVPPPPAPDAELLKLLQAGYALDTDPDKAAKALTLAAVFRQAAKVAAPDPAFKTVKDIDEAVRFAAQGSLGVLAIPHTRDAVGAWLRTQLPVAATTQLDDSLRQRYVVAWTALAISLEKVK